MPLLKAMVFSFGGAMVGFFSGLGVSYPIFVLFMGPTVYKSGAWRDDTSNIIVTGCECLMLCGTIIGGIMGHRIAASRFRSTDGPPRGILSRLPSLKPGSAGL